MTEKHIDEGLKLRSGAFSPAYHDHEALRDRHQEGVAEVWICVHFMIEVEDPQRVNVRHLFKIHLETCGVTVVGCAVRNSGNVLDESRG